jgi:hypothetical protein
MKVKEKFHELIDTINDEEMLKAYYNLIAQLNIQESGELYRQLTDVQKDELNLAYNESFVSSNLISHKEVKAHHEKWM